MSITDIAESMRGRVPWEVAQKILENCDIPRGMGWERTIEKLEESDIPDTGEDDLVEAIREHVLAGEKLVRFFELSEHQMDVLRASVIGSPVDPSNPFAKAYPLNLTEAEIASSPVTKPALAAVEVQEAGTALVFASIRVQEIREPVEVGEEMPEALSAYEQVVGIRHIRRQAMDVVWVPREGVTVDVRVDFPKGMVLEQGAYAHDQVREQLALQVGHDYLSSPTNLFPLIEKIYSNPEEGIVVELAFGTSTASLKHEKMRRAAVCLRKEAYHVGGTNALAVPIDPYRISVQWEREHGDVRSRPELSLQGQFRMTHLLEAPLQEAVIKKCLNTEDYNFVRSRLESYMVSVEPDETDQLVQ